MSGEVDGTCWKLLSGMGVAIVALAGGIVTLWKAFKKSQEQRLNDAGEHTNQMKALYEFILTRRGK